MTIGEKLKKNKPFESFGRAPVTPEF